MSQIYDETERARRAVEDDLRPEVADLFAEQGDRIAEALESLDVDAAEAAAQDPAWATEALGLVWGATAPPFAAAVYEGLTATKATPPTVDEWLQSALGFLQSEGGAMVTAVTDTVLGDLRRLLAAGVADGRGVREVAAELRETWPDLTTERAERIVTTEVMAASNYASELGAERAAEDYGLEMEKVWLSAPADGRRREAHAEADGQRVALGDEFEVGGEAARYPGDPKLSAKQRVRCRCAVAYEPKEEKALRGPLTWTQRRNGHIRAAYRAAIAERYGERDVIIEELREGAFEGDPYEIAFSTCRKVCDSGAA